MGINPLSLTECRYTHRRIGSDPRWFQHEFRPGAAGAIIATKWCVDHLGPGGYGNRWRDDADTAGTIYIRSDDDAFAFRMRWC